MFHYGMVAFIETACPLARIVFFDIYSVVCIPPGETIYAVLFVVYTERGDDTLLITARVAEPKERRIYYGDDTKYLKGWRRVNP
ncbi:hypothetical protein ACYULU_13090 [Breznakiellaceae bacterium SP9]